MPTNEVSKPARRLVVNLVLLAVSKPRMRGLCLGNISLKDQNVCNR